LCQSGTSSERGYRRGWPLHILTGFIESGSGVYVSLSFCAKVSRRVRHTYTHTKKMHCLCDISNPPHHLSLLLLFPSSPPLLCLYRTSIYIYIYIDIYTHTRVCMYVYIYLAFFASLFVNIGKILLRTIICSTCV